MDNSKGNSSIRKALSLVSAKRQSIGKVVRTRGSKTQFNGRLRSFPRKIIPKPLPKDHDKEIVLSDDNGSEHEQLPPRVSERVTHLHKCDMESNMHRNREASPLSAGPSDSGKSASNEETDDSESEFVPPSPPAISAHINEEDNDHILKVQQKRKPTYTRGGPSKRGKHDEDDDLESER